VFMNASEDPEAFGLLAIGNLVSADAQKSVQQIWVAVSALVKTATSEDLLARLDPLFQSL